MKHTLDAIAPQVHSREMEFGVGQDAYVGYGEEAA